LVERPKRVPKLPVVAIAVRAGVNGPRILDVAVVRTRQDLIGTIVRAEEPSSLDGFNEGAEAREANGGYQPESFTWTFYIVGTNKGTVTIRWFGSSNGYYSQSPRFYKEGSGDE